MPRCEPANFPSTPLWRAHTPQPEGPPPGEPGPGDVPPIGDPPAEPDEVPHSVGAVARRFCIAPRSRLRTYVFMY